jgi:hypothetical protein
MLDDLFIAFVVMVVSIVSAVGLWMVMELIYRCWPCSCCARKPKVVFKLVPV